LNDIVRRAKSVHKSGRGRAMRHGLPIGRTGN